MLSADLKHSTSKTWKTQELNDIHSMVADDIDDIDPEEEDARTSPMRLQEMDEEQTNQRIQPKGLKKMATTIINPKRVGQRQAVGPQINVILQAEHSHHHSSRYVLNPNGWICRVWGIFTSLMVIYVVGVVSFDIGFSWWKIRRSTYRLGQVVDIFFWIDMVVSFNTGFVHTGHLVMDRKEIAMHYFHFWFWIDLAANVPWEGLLLTSKSNRKAVKFLKWLKLPKLLRLGRLRKIMKANARYMNLMLLCSSLVLFVHLGACFWVFLLDPCRHYYEEEPYSEWDYNDEVDEVLVHRNPKLGWECTQGNLFNIYMQAVHASAGMLLGVDCANFGGFFAGGGFNEAMSEEIAEYSAFLGDTPETTAAEPDAARMRSIKLWLLRRRYPMSLGDEIDTSTNTALQGLSIQPHMNTFGLSYAWPMNFFGTVMLMLGIYFQGCLFALLTKFVIARNHAESMFRQAHDEAKRELEYFGHLIPEFVQKRISKHFEFRWINQAYGPLHLLQPDLLSQSLRNELAIYLYKEAVTKVEFLENAPLGILTKICLHLQPRDYMQQDLVYRRGEPVVGLHIVDKGRVLIADRAAYTHQEVEDMISNSVGETIESGGHFGAGAVIAAIQAQAEMSRTTVANKKSAIAMTVCHMFVLPVEIFREVAEEHPKFFHDLRYLKEEADTETPAQESSRLSVVSSTIDKGDVARVPPARKALETRVAGLESTVKSQGEKLDELLESLKTLQVLLIGQAQRPNSSHHSQSGSNGTEQ
jgi:CRP-like cAMP-binding protein